MLVRTAVSENAENERALGPFVVEVRRAIQTAPLSPTYTRYVSRQLPRPSPAQSRRHAFSVTVVVCSYVVLQHSSYICNNTGSLQSPWYLTGRIHNITWQAVMSRYRSQTHLRLMVYSRGHQLSDASISRVRSRAQPLSLQ